MSDRNAAKTSSMDFGSTASFAVGTEGAAGAATDWEDVCTGEASVFCGEHAIRTQEKMHADLPLVTMVPLISLAFLADSPGVWLPVPSTYIGENSLSFQKVQGDLPLPDLVPFFLRVCLVRGEAFGEFRLFLTGPTDTIAAGARRRYFSVKMWGFWTIRVKFTGGPVSSTRRADDGRLPK